MTTDYLSALEGVASAARSFREAAIRCMESSHVDCNCGDAEIQRLSDALDTLDRESKKKSDA
jgi:hypothetical protein